MTRRIVFVTGGAGFIGSNIVAKLAEDPALDVVVCDRLHSVESGKWRNLAKHPIGDFVAPEAMFDWLEKRWRDIELVVHTAALSATAAPDADTIIHSNFGLSRDLFRWCTDRQRRLIYASSAATYGDGAQGFADRDDVASLAALRPLSTYAWSKALFDVFAARQAGRDYAPPQWVGLKLFNVYGPNEEHKGPMKSVVTHTWPRAANGAVAKLFKTDRPGVADGEHRRDFTYVRDVAEVVAWLMANPQVSGIYNLGTGQARSFNELAAAVFQLCGRQPSIDYIDMTVSLHGCYQAFTEAQIGRLREAGYTAPFASLEEGIADYVQAFLSQPDPHR
jgi:ADP-L-glycero-D-manno-heptose 6-epimerase